MKLSYLRIFVFVMEEGTLARAAKRSNTSQPAASRLLRLLEDDLQIALFMRHKKRLVPTSEAQQLYPEAARILASVDGVPDFIRQIRSGHSTPIRVACHFRIADSLVVPALIRLSQQQPDLRVHLDVHMRSNLERLFAQELFDVGVGVLPVSTDDFIREVLCETELQVLVSRKHPLAKKRSLTSLDLEPYKYIGLPRQTVVRDLIDETMRQTGVHLDPFHEFSNSAVGHHIVQNTNYYTISDCYSVPTYLLKDLVLVKLLPSMRIQFGLFSNPRSHKHTATDEFITSVREVANRLGA